MRGMEVNFLGKSKYNSFSFLLITAWKYDSSSCEANFNDMPEYVIVKSLTSFFNGSILIFFFFN